MFLKECMALSDKVLDKAYALSLFKSSGKLLVYSLHLKDHRDIYNMRDTVSEVFRFIRIPGRDLLSGFSTFSYCSKYNSKLYVVGAYYSCNAKETNELGEQFFHNRFKEAFISNALAKPLFDKITSQRNRDLSLLDISKFDDNYIGILNAMFNPSNEGFK